MAVQAIVYKTGEDVPGEPVTAHVQAEAGFVLLWLGRHYVDFSPEAAAEIARDLLDAVNAQ